MFARAGINLDDARYVCSAVIRRRGWHPWRWEPSHLFTWPGGDFAWCGGGGASWPHQIVIGNWLASSSSGDRARSVLPA